MTITWEDAAFRTVDYIVGTDYAHILNLEAIDQWLNVGAELTAEDFASIAQSAARNSLLAQPYSPVGTLYQSIAETVIAKQKDYGHGNIMRHGLQGVIVRMCDKVERIKNLESKRFGEPVNESLDDSWLDLVGYCIIAIMLLQGTFELPLEQDRETDGLPLLSGSELFAGRKPYGVRALPCQVICENGYVYAWSQPSNSWVFVGQKAPV